MEPDRRTQARRWAGMFLLMGSAVLAAWGVYGLSLVPTDLSIPLEWPQLTSWPGFDAGVWVLFLAPALILSVALFTQLGTAWLPRRVQPRRFIWWMLALIVLLGSAFQYMITVRALELASAAP